MGEYKGPDWYDDYYRKNREPSAELTAIHDECAKRVIALEATEVIDIGCGPGWFEKRLRALRFKGDYHGFDTSIEAIRQARTRASTSRHVSTWSTLDIEEPSTRRPVWTFIEVLEHIPEDVDVLRSIVRLNGQVVISVPTYDCPSHVRWFSMEDDLIARYGLAPDAEQYEINRQIYIVGKRGA